MGGNERTYDLSLHLSLSDGTTHQLNSVTYNQWMLNTNYISYERKSALKAIKYTVSGGSVFSLWNMIILLPHWPPQMESHPLMSLVSFFALPPGCLQPLSFLLFPQSRPSVKTQLAHYCLPDKESEFLYQASQGLLQSCRPLGWSSPCPIFKT